jgi:hypothetical protein
MKKQSQFVPGLLGATSFMKGDYGKNPAAGNEKTKPIKLVPSTGSGQALSSVEWSQFQGLKFLAFSEKVRN